MSIKMSQKSTSKATTLYIYNTYNTTLQLILRSSFLIHSFLIHIHIHETRFRNTKIVGVGEREYG